MDFAPEFFEVGVPALQGGGPAARGAHLEPILGQKSTGVGVSLFWAGRSRPDHFFMKIYVAGKPWYDFGADWPSGSRV